MDAKDTGQPTPPPDPDSDTSTPTRDEVLARLRDDPTSVTNRERKIWRANNLLTPEEFDEYFPVSREVEHAAAGMAQRYLDASKVALTNMAPLARLAAESRSLGAASLAHDPAVSQARAINAVSAQIEALATLAKATNGQLQALINVSKETNKALEDVKVAVVAQTQLVKDQKWMTRALLVVTVLLLASTLALVLQIHLQL